VIPPFHQLDPRRNTAEIREVAHKPGIFGSKLVLDHVENPLIVVSRLHICLRASCGFHFWPVGLLAAPPGDRRGAYAQRPGDDRAPSSRRLTIFGVPGHYAGLAGERNFAVRNAHS
jgi:hypothetical protein